MDRVRAKGVKPSLITSRSNPLIVYAASLSEKKFRDKSGCFFIEGIKLFREALAAGVEYEHVFIREDVYDKFRSVVPDGKAVVVSEAVYGKISREKSPEGILCVAKRIDFLHKCVKIYNNENKSGTDENMKTVFMASQIRDPGNLGTIIRDANALGIDELIISSDCVDLYNPRTVRAAMGALFRQKITVCADMVSSIAALRGLGYVVLAATLNASSVKLTDVHVDSHTCFVVGNEGHGLDTELIKACTGSVIIPMREGSESLNAAAAAAILIWETGKKSWIR